MHTHIGFYRYQECFTSASQSRCCAPTLCRGCVPPDTYPCCCCPAAAAACSALQVRPVSVRPVRPVLVRAGGDLGDQAQQAARDASKGVSPLLPAVLFVCQCCMPASMCCSSAMQQTCALRMCLARATPIASWQTVFRTCCMLHACPHSGGKHRCAISQKQAFTSYCSVLLLPPSPSLLLPTHHGLPS